MLNFLTDFYENRMPYHRLLGIKVEHLSMKEVKVKVQMKEDLIGNFVRGSLHGGVISSILDLTGGLIATVELLKNIEGNDIEEIGRRIARVGTIDLRTDYLRAGKGEFFIATGSILRKGNKVAVARTELTNNKNSLIAAGTGTYLIG